MPYSRLLLPRRSHAHPRELADAVADLGGEKLKVPSLSLFLTFCRCIRPPETTDKRPLSHVSPGRVSSPMPPPLPTPSLGWCTCVLAHREPCAANKITKKIREKQRWPSETKKGKNIRTVPMRTCVHVHTLKEITALKLLLASSTKR